MAQLPDKPPESTLLPGRQPRAPDTGAGSSVTFSGLVLHYPCDDLTTTDTSGNSNTGTLFGSSNVLSTGLINNKITLGSASGIQFTSTSLLGLATSTSALSISCWIKTTTLDCTIVSLRNTTNAQTLFDLVLGYNGVDNLNTGRLSLCVRDDGGAGLVTVSGTTAINDGNWHYIVYTRTTGKVDTIYCDNVSVGTVTDTMTSAVTPNVAGSAIGYEIIAGGRPLVGSIDDYQHYNRALTTTEIAAIYNGAVPPSGYTLSATTAAFVIQVFAAGTLYGRTLQQTTVGNFTFTGIASNSSRTYLVISTTGAFTFNGIATGLLKGDVLPAVTGAFAFTGIVANLLYSAGINSYVMTAAPVAFIFTGLNANLNYLPLVNYVLVCGTGQFYFTGLGVGSPGQGLLSGSGLGTPVVTIPFGGAPIIDVTYLGLKAGAPVSEAAPGEGTPVTKVTTGGTPVVYI